MTITQDSSRSCGTPTGRGRPCTPSAELPTAKTRRLAGSRLWGRPLSTQPQCRGSRPRAPTLVHPQPVNSKATGESALRSVRPGLSVGHVPGQRSGTLVAVAAAWTPLVKSLNWRHKSRPGTRACSSQTTSRQPCLFSGTRAETHSRQRKEMTRRVAHPDRGAASAR